MSDTRFEEIFSDDATGSRRTERFRLNRQRLTAGWLRCKARWFIQTFLPDCLTDFDLNWDTDTLLELVRLCSNVLHHSDLQLLTHCTTFALQLLEPLWFLGRERFQDHLKTSTKHSLCGTFCMADGQCLCAKLQHPYSFATMQVCGHVLTQGKVQANLALVVVVVKAVEKGVVGEEVVGSRRGNTQLHVPTARDAGGKYSVETVMPAVCVISLAGCFVNGRGVAVSSFALSARSNIWAILFSVQFT